MHLRVRLRCRRLRCGFVFRVVDTIGLSARLRLGRIRLWEWLEVALEIKGGLVSYSKTPSRKRTAQRLEKFCTTPVNVITVPHPSTKMDR